jgi:hypothetical protein
MPFLTKDDLKSSIQIEVINEITRGDDNLVTTAIIAAINEMKLYLNRFDVVAMFGIMPTGEATVGEEGTENNGTEPTFKDEFIKSLACDIACWQLLKLGNPNVNIEFFRTVYTDAIKTLKEVMKGTVDPPWPKRYNNPENKFDVSGHIASFSNNKRNNHY